MTIREVLEADCNADKIDVTVREKETTKYIMRYCIGRDVTPGKSQRFAYEAEAGDVYENCRMKTLFINKIIQFHQLEKKPQGKEMCRGVIMKEIPKELLDLEIEYMRPYDCGWSHELHGYNFNCYVDSWSGISGETKQAELFS